MARQPITDPEVLRKVFSMAPSLQYSISGNPMGMMQNRGLYDVLQQHELARQQEAMQKQKEYEASRLPGLLGAGQSVVEGIADPFVRLGQVGLVGLEDLQGRGDFARKLEKDFFGEDANLTQEALKGALGVGSWFVPGLGPAGGIMNLATRGALAGGMGALSQQDFLQEDIDLGKLATGAALGGGIGGALGVGGKLLGKLRGPTLDTVDDAIAKTGKKLTEKGGNKALSLGSTTPGKTGKISAQLNALTGGTDVGLKLNPGDRVRLASDMLSRYGDDIPQAGKMLLGDIIEKGGQGTSTIAQGAREGGRRLGEVVDDMVPKSITKPPQTGFLGKSLGAADDVTSGAGQMVDDAGMTVYQGGKGKWFTTDPNYAKNFGKVSQAKVDPNRVLDLSNPMHRERVQSILGPENPLTMGKLAPTPNDKGIIDDLWKNLGDDFDAIKVNEFPGSAKQLVGKDYSTATSLYTPRGLPGTQQPGRLAQPAQGAQSATSTQLGQVADDVAGYPQTFNQKLGLASKPEVGGVKGKVLDFARAARKTALRRQIGSAPPSFKGGVSKDQVADAILDKSDELGVSISSADDLVGFGDDLMARNKGSILDATKAAANQGKVIDLREPIDDLLRYRGTQFQSSRKGIETAIEDVVEKSTGISRIQTETIDEYVSRTANDLAQVDPTIAYGVKQLAGSKGKFSNAILDRLNTPEKKEVYNKIFGSTSDRLRKIVPGYDKINAEVELGLKSKTWAAKALESNSTATLINDPIQDAIFGGAFFAGAPGAAAGYAAHRYLGSPSFMGAVGGMLEKGVSGVGTSGVLGKLGRAGALTQAGLRSPVTRAVGRGMTPVIASTAGQQVGAMGGGSMGGDVLGAQSSGMTSSDPMSQGMGMGMGMGMVDGMSSGGGYGSMSGGGGFGGGSRLQQLYEVNNSLGGTVDTIPLAMKILEFTTPEAGGMSDMSDSQISAMSGLESLRTLREKAPDFGTRLGSKLGIPTSDVQIFDTSRKNLGDILARLRTGAAINEVEERLYLTEFMPSLLDTPESIDYKLDMWERLLNRIAQTGGGTSMQQQQQQQQMGMGMQQPSLSEIYSG